MTERLPLVLIDGDIQQLPTEDSILGSDGSAFLRTPDEVDDTDETYFYWGWTDTAAGSWQVRRTLRANAAKTDATIVGDAGYADLAAAWIDRATLTYS